MNIIIILIIGVLLAIYNIIDEFKKKNYIKFGFYCFGLGVILQYLITLIFKP